MPRNAAPAANASASQPIATDASSSSAVNVIVSPPLMIQNGLNRSASRPAGRLSTATARADGSSASPISPDDNPLTSLNMNGWTTSDPTMAAMAQNPTTHSSK